MQLEQDTSSLQYSGEEKSGEDVNGEVMSGENIEERVERTVVKKRVERILGERVRAVGEMKVGS